jgi:hypothetical protein
MIRSVVGEDAVSCLLSAVCLPSCLLSYGTLRPPLALPVHALSLHTLSAVCRLLSGFGFWRLVFAICCQISGVCCLLSAVYCLSSARPRPPPPCSRCTSPMPFEHYDNSTLTNCS